jgi:methyltransferase family protein
LIPDTIQSEIDDFYRSSLKVDCHGVVAHRGGSPRKVECELLANLVLSIRPVDTIDWGLGDAAVCIAIVLAKRQLGIQRPHISLDPFQTLLSKDVGLIQLRQRQLDRDVEFLPQRSEDYLVAAAATGLKFDFIFVDGDHGYGAKITDAHLADRVLKPGGVLAFHDGLFNSTAAAVQYLLRDRNYELMPLPCEPRWKSAARQIRHARRLGFSYAAKVIPALGVSIACLRKPVGHSSERTSQE